MKTTLRARAARSQTTPTEAGAAALQFRPSQAPFEDPPVFPRAATRSATSEPAAELDRPRDTLRAALPLVTAALAVAAFALSLRAASAIDAQLLVASALALLVLTVRAMDRTPAPRTPDHPPTETPRMDKQTPETSSHVLIEGLFEGHDAQELLLTLLNAKIDYHTRRCFSSEERFRVPDLDSERRVKALTATRDRVREVLARAIAEGDHLEIHSTLELRPVKEPVLE